MNPVLKIILKYSLIIFIARFIIGFIIEFLPLDTRIFVILIAFIPIIFLCWISSYNGTINLGKYIKEKRKLELLGLSIITIPILIDTIISIFILKSADGISGSLLIITICALAVNRATKKIFSR
jgi:hypothetical protein